MTGVLAHALPRVCEIVGAAAGGHEEVDKTETREKKEEREAASHALELVHEIHRKVNVGARSMADLSYTRIYLSPLVVLD